MHDSDSAIRLVVNADGFGFDPALSRGILRAHREGIVTSTSIIGNCADPAAIRAELLSAPTLGIGAQLTLTGGAPVAQPSTIPSLLEPEGCFPTDVRQGFLSWAKAAPRADEIEREFDSQVARLRDAGLAIDHLNTCHHVGFLPVVGRAVEAVARRHGIAGVRTSMESPTLAWFTEIRRSLSTAALGGLAWYNRRQMGVLRHGPTSWGYFERGRLDEIRILETLGRLGPGIHELICAPREADDPKQSRELAALLAPRVRAGLAQRGIALCRWAELF
ncbi:MAG TPA: ChbG/HpnK family deacetylase [Polyangia bacterium]